MYLQVCRRSATPTRAKKASENKSLSVHLNFSVVRYTSRPLIRFVFFVFRFGSTQSFRMVHVKASTAIGHSQAIQRLSREHVATV